MKTLPTFDIENEIMATMPDGALIAGVDEAGRGPLCGPVVAAAVVFLPQAKKQCEVCSVNCEVKSENNSTLHTTHFTLLITDSKQMTAPQRAAACAWIKENCLWAVGKCSPAKIDEINILQASMLAMKRAVAALPRAPDFVLVDGNRLPDNIKCEVWSVKCEINERKTSHSTLHTPHYHGKAVVKGDSKSLSIAAASIIAKETRDKIMRDLAAEFPEYGWEKNAGYPTASHLQAIKKYGINEHYRKSYKPVKELL